jgi:hypothetical protein
VLMILLDRHITINGISCCESGDAIRINLNELEQKGNVWQFFKMCTMFMVHTF